MAQAYACPRTLCFKPRAEYANNGFTTFWPALELLLWKGYQGGHSALYSVLLKVQYYYVTSILLCITSGSRTEESMIGVWCFNPSLLIQSSDFTSILPCINSRSSTGKPIIGARHFNATTDYSRDFTKPNNNRTNAPNLQGNTLRDKPSKQCASKALMDSHNAFHNRFVDVVAGHLMTKHRIYWR